MSERYTKLFALPENQYAVGAPVLIAAGALLKDNQTGKVLAQFKFKSISPKKIKAVKISVTAFDVSGKEVDGVAEYQYLDLSVSRDAGFGQKQAVPLPNAITRSIGVECTDVIFADGTAWNKPEEAEWGEMPEQMQAEIRERQVLTQKKSRKMSNLCVAIWGVAVVLEILGIVIGRGSYAGRSIIRILIASIMPGLFWLAVRKNWSQKQMKNLWVASAAALGIQLAAIAAMLVLPRFNWLLCYIDGSSFISSLSFLFGSYSFSFTLLGKISVIFSVLRDMCFIAKNAVCLWGLWQYRNLHTKA